MCIRDSLICNRELLFIGKRKDEDDMAKSTMTYEERIRALEKKEQESIEAVSYTHLDAGRLPYVPPPVPGCAGQCGQHVPRNACPLGA